MVHAPYSTDEHPAQVGKVADNGNQPASPPPLSPHSHSPETVFFASSLPFLPKSKRRRKKKHRRCLGQVGLGVPVFFILRPTKAKGAESRMKRKTDDQDVVALFLFLFASPCLLPSDGGRGGVGPSRARAKNQHVLDTQARSKAGKRDDRLRTEKASCNYKSIVRCIYTRHMQTWSRPPSSSARGSLLFSPTPLIT